MDQLREVKTYHFRHPCIVCGQFVKLRSHFKHFRLFHDQIDLKFYCYLCLQIHAPLGRHRKECAAAINEARRIPPIVLEGDMWCPWRYNWYKQYADEESVPENSLLHLFDNMPTYPKRYTSNPETVVDLKFRCIEGKRAVVKPLALNETNFDTFVQWIIYNNSQIYNEKLKLVIQCLLEYRENKWYHIIVSQYHLEKFASLINETDAGFTMFQCLCVTSDQETQRTLHAHFLVHIDEIVTFKKKCWNKLLSPTGERYKMCISIKDFFHLYSVIFYLSQKRPCSDVRKTKHFDLKVHLNQQQENLALLIFRRLYYNNVMSSFRNQASILKFDIHKVTDEQRNNHYVSPAKNILKLIRRNLIFENVQLQEVQEPNYNCITFSNSGYLQLVKSNEPTQDTTMADILLAADKHLENCWILWEPHKVELINLLLKVRGPTNTVAIYLDDNNVLAFFGDNLRVEFSLPEEKEIAILKLITVAAAKNIIVSDNQQRELITEIIDKHIKTTVLPPHLILVEGQRCLDTAKRMYYLASRQVL